MAWIDADRGDRLTIDDHWDAATTSAVKRWQADTDQDETGRIDRSLVVLLPGARRVGTVTAQRGAAAGAGLAVQHGSGLRSGEG